VETFRFGGVSGALEDSGEAVPNKEMRFDTSQARCTKKRTHELVRLARRRHGLNYHEKATRRKAPVNFLQESLDIWHKVEYVLAHNAVESAQPVRVVFIFSAHKARVNETMNSPFRERNHHPRAVNPYGAMTSGGKVVDQRPGSTSDVEHRHPRFQT
jgi:hypothetical protein